MRLRYQALRVSGDVQRRVHWVEGIENIVCSTSKYPRQFDFGHADNPSMWERLSWTETGPAHYRNVESQGLLQGTYKDILPDDHSGWKVPAAASLCASLCNHIMLEILGLDVALEHNVDFLIRPSFPRNHKTVSQRAWKTGS
jgi:hypothetical protein